MVIGIDCALWTSARSAPLTTTPRTLPLMKSAKICRKLQDWERAFGQADKSVAPSHWDNYRGSARYAVARVFCAGPARFLHGLLLCDRTGIRSYTYKWNT